MGEALRRPPAGINLYFYVATSSNILHVAGTQNRPKDLKLRFEEELIQLRRITLPLSSTLSCFRLLLSFLFFSVVVCNLSIQHGSSNMT